MKKIFKRSLGILLSILMVVAILPQMTIKAKASTGVEEFVTRCYRVALGREPEPKGFADWTSKLNNGQIVGFVIAREFIFSDEYKSKNKSDEDFVKDLYMMFVNREPEPAGYEYWMNNLSQNMRREDVFAGFSNSKEFIDLCTSYGITAGYYSNDYDVSQINNVNLFVQRLYKTTLNRIGDPEGQEYWVKGLLEKRLNGSECAANFVRSNEFINKKLSNTDYLIVLYAGIMGRNPDEAGMKYWLDALDKKTLTRDQVFEGFSKSEEFKNICASYGIEVGNYTATDVTPDGPDMNEVEKIWVVTSLREYKSSGSLDGDYSFDFSFWRTDDGYGEKQENTSKDKAYYHYYNNEGYCIKSVFYENGKETVQIKEYDSNNFLIRVDKYVDGVYTGYSEIIKKDDKGQWFTNAVAINYDAEGNVIDNTFWFYTTFIGITQEEFEYLDNDNTQYYKTYFKDSNTKVTEYTDGRKIINKYRQLGDIL